MPEGYAMAYTAFELGKSPVVGEPTESSPAGRPCNASTSLLGDCCPFPGELLAALKPMGNFMMDVQSTSQKKRK